jgi:cell division protein FtsI/penicillin-binding protein 2
MLVGGKTGTADKPRKRTGGYYEDKVIATFAGSSRRTTRATCSSSRSTSR